MWNLKGQRPISKIVQNNRVYTSKSDVAHQSNKYSVN